MRQAGVRAEPWQCGNTWRIRLVGRPGSGRGTWKSQPGYESPEAFPTHVLEAISGLEDET